MLDTVSEPLKNLVRQSLSIAGYEVRRIPGKGFYNADRLFTSHNHDFMDDPVFLESFNYALDVTKASDPKNYWRVHIALVVSAWAARSGGAFAECGVANGCTSLSVLKYLELNKINPPSIYLFDTFEGLDQNIVTEDEKKYWGESTKERQEYWEREVYPQGWNYNAVVDRFRPHETVRVYKGSCPEILYEKEPEFSGEKFSFIHIDMNNATPEVGALEFFKSRLHSSAFILLDDYAYYGYGYQKIAADKWAKGNGFIIASLPTGQGLIFANGN